MTWKAGYTTTITATMILKLGNIFRRTRLDWVDLFGLAESVCEPDHGASKSTKKYGYLRNRHGSQNSTKSMIDRSRTTENPQGNFSDNRIIEEAFDKTLSTVYYLDGTSK